MPRGRKPGERLRRTRMAKRFDNTGVVAIQASDGLFRAMKLENMPTPPDYGQVVDGWHRYYVDTRSMGADSERYRVFWSTRPSPESKTFSSSSFTIGGGHVVETLYVLAEFLRDQGVEFLALGNRHGAMFKDVRLSGSNFAYLTRNIPHSPACHVDFIEADTPEVVRAPGRILYNPSFNGTEDGLGVGDININ